MHILISDKHIFTPIPSGANLLIARLLIGSQLAFYLKANHRFQPRFFLLSLVHQIRDWFRGAAAYFGWMREAKRKNTRCGLRPMSDKAAEPKAARPGGLR
jgi:hypothetical protein